MLREATELMEKAYVVYEELIRPYRSNDSSRMDEAMAKCWPPASLTSAQRAAVLYIGADLSRYTNHPSFFAKLAEKEDWDADTLVRLGSGWYMQRPSNCVPEIPSFVKQRLGEGAILLTIIEQAPDNSTAYIRAARQFFRNDLTTDQIEEFRSLWDRLPEDRREAISIALGTDECYWHHHRDVLVINPTPSKIDLVTYATRRPSAVKSRPRWTDRTTHVLRHSLWSAYAASCAEFARNCAADGEERGQVGALLEGLRVAPRLHIRDLQNLLKSSGAALAFNHYTFSPAEENLWGPDFAFLFCYSENKGLSLSRYVQFQAKRVKNGSVVIRRDQLNSLLRSSWHSSFYVMWSAGMVARAIHAPLLKKLAEGSSAAAPSVPWSLVEEHSDLLSALIGDRILCAELGDDPELPGTDPAEVSRRLADMYGRPRYGILSLSVQIGDDSHGDGGFGVIDLDAHSE